MKTIQLTNGGETLVDDSDYDSLIKFPWYRLDGKYKSYACYRIGGHSNGCLLYLHNLISNVKDGQEVHHENENGLDNQRLNLKVMSLVEHRGTRKPFKGQKHKGISWATDKQKYCAYIYKNSVRKHLGYFDKIDNALTAYNQAAKDYFGTSAYQNTLVMGLTGDDKSSLL